MPDPRQQRDKRYQKSYGISLAEYEAQDVRQGHCCAACGRFCEGELPLSVDHDHAVERSRIVVRGQLNHWQAFIPDFLEQFDGTSRQDVKQQAKRWLLRRSVRGLLCWLCNTALRKFGDRPAALRGAADYVDSYRAGRGIMELSDGNVALP